MIKVISQDVSVDMMHQDGHIWSGVLTKKPFNLSVREHLADLNFRMLYKTAWRRKWQPTLVFLPGESVGQGSLAGYTVHGVAKSPTRLSNYTHKVASTQKCSGYKRMTCWRRATDWRRPRKHYNQMSCGILGEVLDQKANTGTTGDIWIDSFTVAGWMKSV